MGTGIPYPSQIAVSGLTGTLTGITVTLTGYTHSFTDDVGALLVGPQGQRTLLFDGAGSGEASDLTLVFDDAATDPLPDRGTFSSGTYRPGQNQYGDVFAAPAPQGPYATDLTAFRGTDPNGTYSLYIQDSTQDDAGTLSGWRITLSGVSAAPEPNAAVLLCVGLAGLTPCRKRKISDRLRRCGLFQAQSAT